MGGDPFEFKGTIKVRLLDTRQAAAFLGIAEKTLKDFRLDGKGPPFLVLTDGPSGRVRYVEADLIEWVQSRKVRSTAEQKVKAAQRNAAKAKAPPVAAISKKIPPPRRTPPVATISKKIPPPRITPPVTVSPPPGGYPPGRWSPEFIESMESIALEMAIWEAERKVKVKGKGI